MENLEYILNHMAGVFHTGIFCQQAEKLISYEENPEYNPLYCNEALRRSLMDSADKQKEPMMLRDQFHMFFLCVKKEDAYFLMGPLCTQVMSRTERHRFYHYYDIDVKWEKGLHYHTLMEILQMTGLLAKIITGEEYSDQQLVDANYQAVAVVEEREEQIWFDIKSEDEDIYRHTYQEERRITDAVKSGNMEEAVRRSKEMDVNVGRLGESELEHWRNLAIVAATLCARAAIEGGVLPSVAYRISGFYINKCTACKDITQILIYRNHAVEELARRVRDQKEKKHSSSYTERCKDYVFTHYREKIYLDDIAETLGISSSYLSRLFKKEMGISLQDFVNDVRVEKAANLLRYSEETLPGIAEYVNFPSQSYFGKIFKQKMNMTPKQYREQYKPMEFYEGGEE
ncbi:MAG: AraC family transcriptional regulator [Clostridiales bacterium]|nr:AraC family transcriptional regulator [Clostridiales bacterium]